MDKNFSAFLTKTYDVLKKVVEKLNEKYEYASVLASDCQGEKVTVTNKNVNVKDSEWNERGFVIRVFHDGLFSEYSFSSIKDVDEICRRVSEAIYIQEPLYKAIYAKAYKNQLYEEEKIEKTFSRMGSFESVSTEDVISSCQKIIDDSMEENEYIISASCVVEYLKISKMFISKNKDLKQVYSWADASYQCVVNRNETTKINYGGKSDVSLAKVLEKLKKSIANINSDATTLLDAKHIVPGEYVCITSPAISGLIAHEAFGHGVEMDMFVKDRALAKQYVNKQVASPLVNMHDGASIIHSSASYFFDDDGVLASDTTIIKNGILQTGISDVLSASILNSKPTGNGRRESYKRKSYSRMTNTYFVEGKSKVEDMIKSIEHGYLLSQTENGMEDPKNWNIQCVCAYGREIKNGKFTGKIVAPVCMSGNVLDLLNSISMVSDEIEVIGSGHCGKGYKEWVVVSDGGPYLKGRCKLG